MRQTSQTAVSFSALIPGRETTNWPYGYYGNAMRWVSQKKTTRCNSLCRALKPRKAHFLEVGRHYLANFSVGVFAFQDFGYTCARVVGKWLNYSAVCAAVHCGTRNTVPIYEHDSPQAATALLVTVENVHVCTIHVLCFVSA